MNTGVFPQSTILVSAIRGTSPLGAISPHVPDVRVHSHVSLFSRNVWACKVMYRGSAVNALVGLGFPPQMPQKRSRHMQTTFGGCSRRGWGGLLSKTAVSEAISGSRAVHTWFCSYSCMAGDLARADQGLFSKIYCQKRDIN